MSEAVSKTKASKGANQEGLREMRMVAMGGGGHRTAALKSLKIMSFRICVPKPAQVQNITEVRPGSAAWKAGL